MLANFLFAPPAYRRDTMSIVRWWESRRLAYNAIVGVVGICSVIAIHLAAWLSPGPTVPGPPLMFIVAYGIAANGCYTLGWMIESALQRMWGNRVPEIGPALFRQGLAFSVGLTALPMLISGVMWAGRIAAFFFQR